MSSPTHAKPRKNIAMILHSAATAVLAVTVCLAYLLIPGLPLNAPSAADASAPNATAATVVPVMAAPVEMGGMKGAFLSPGQDFYVTGDESDDIIQLQIDTAFADIADWGLDTLLVPMDPSVMLASGTAPADDNVFDAVRYIADTAHAKGMKVYGVLDMTVGCGDGQNDPASPAGYAALAALGARAGQYALDGYLLDDYGYPKAGPGMVSAVDFAAYQSAGLKTGYEAYLTSCIRNAVANVRTVLKTEDPAAPVGLLASPIWADSGYDARGIDLQNTDYAEYADGRADTLDMVNSGLADFVMVKNYMNTDSGFDEVLNWWNDTLPGTSLYMALASDKVDGGEPGWDDGQLAKQVTACRAANNFKGVVFNSIAALKAHEESTGAMWQALAGNPPPEQAQTDAEAPAAEQQLSIQSPSKQNSTVYSSTVSFRGSADPNAPLTMNGQPVDVTDHGFFSVDAPLQLGPNKFVFVHKDKTVTYTVTYAIKVFQSVSPTGSLNLDGGSSLTVSASAHTGSSVTASLNGQTVALAPVTARDDGSMDTTTFTSYTGIFTLPDGIVGKAQSLGKVSFSASYIGNKETVTGGSVTVKALPKPAPPPTQGDGGSVNPINSDVPPINPGLGSTILASGKVMIVTSDYAETMTVADQDFPTNSYLPKGTTDILTKTAYDASSGTSFYVLGNGKMVYQSDAAVYIDNGKLTASSVKAQPVTRDSASTRLTLATDWRVPYQLRLLPQKYNREGKDGDYYIAAQTTDYIDITFYYTTSVGAAPDFSGDPMIKSAEWIQGTGNTYTLRLYLVRTGGFYGYSVKWNKDSSLTFTFKYPKSAAGSSSSKPLTGDTIVLDPGHGGDSTGTAAGSLAEKTLNLRYSLDLKTKLEALGAKVVMTRTTDITMDMPTRVKITRDANADLFISIHMNGADSSSACGPSIHYFNEYSAAVAKSVNGRLATLYGQYGVKSRGDCWSPFYVTRNHDLPAILVECGFMTNSGDLERLVSADFQDKLTAAIANGAVDYFKALPKVTPNPTPVTTTATITTATTILTAGQAGTNTTTDTGTETADTAADTDAAASTADTGAAATTATGTTAKPTATTGAPKG